MNELLINGVDASTYGVKLSPGSVGKLLVPVTYKDYVSNESRLEHGVRVLIPSTPKVASREVTLTFQVNADTEVAFESRKEALLGELKSGALTIQLPTKSSEIFKLVYLGGTSYTGGLSGHACKITAKFLEPNPADRIGSIL